MIRKLSHRSIILNCLLFKGFHCVQRDTINVTLFTFSIFHTSIPILIERSKNKRNFFKLRDSETRHGTEKMKKRNVKDKQGNSDLEGKEISIEKRYLSRTVAGG